jgi:hypothetical protein
MADQLEILQVADDEMLCAFMLNVEGVSIENLARLRRLWTDYIMPDAVMQLRMYLRNMEMQGVHGD